MTTPSASYSTNVKKRPVAVTIGKATRYIAVADARALQASLRDAIATAEAFQAASGRRLARVRVWIARFAKL